MRLRSLLFVPGDRPDRFAKAAGSGADALILDLEDAVAPEKKPAARAAVAAWLAEPRVIFCFVRVNPLGGDEIQADLDAIMPARPDGLVLPKAEGASSLRALTDLVGGGLPPVMPIASETAAGVFQLPTYREVAADLAALTWGAEDLPAAIGATAARHQDGSYTAPYEMVRALALFGAHAAGVPAIETVYPDIADLAGLAAYAARGRRDGFTGMMAIHPAQVAIINAGFTPGEDEIARARVVVAAFAANPGAGALALDGRMIDRPHLHQAQELLRRVED